MNVEKTLHDLKIEAFVNCVVSSIEFMEFDEAIAHARKMASNDMDSYQIEEGEKLAKEWFNS